MEDHTKCLFVVETAFHFAYTIFAGRTHVIGMLYVIIPSVHFPPSSTITIILISESWVFKQVVNISVVILLIMHY